MQGEKKSQAVTSEIKKPIGEDAVNWIIQQLGIDKSRSTESERIMEYKKSLSDKEAEPFGETTVNYLFDKLGINPNNIKNIDLFNFSNDNNTPMNDDNNSKAFGDETVNWILDKINIFSDDKSSNNWLLEKFNNNEEYYSQLKRKYYNSTSEKREMMFDRIVKELQEKENLSKIEATKKSLKILEIDQ